MAVAMHRRSSAASGAGSLNVAASVFMRQKPRAPLTDSSRYLPRDCTRSELITVHDRPAWRTSRAAVMRRLHRRSGLEAMIHSPDRRRHDRPGHHHARQDAGAGDRRAAHRWGRVTIEGGARPTVNVVDAAASGRGDRPATGAGRRRECSSRFLALIALLQRRFLGWHAHDCPWSAGRRCRLERVLRSPCSRPMALDDPRLCPWTRLHPRSATCSAPASRSIEFVAVLCNSARSRRTLDPKSWHRRHLRALRLCELHEEVLETGAMVAIRS